MEPEVDLSKTVPITKEEAGKLNQFLNRVV